MIAVKAAVKKMLIKMDRFSPYPVFYSLRMSSSEKAIFDEAIKGARHYLEFGSGGSTIRALQRSKAMIYTVETSPEWIDHIRKYVLVRYFEKKRLRIFFVDIGPTRTWGYPGSDTFKNMFGTYSSNIFQYIDSKLLDLVLIDGRFRVACALKVVLECHKNRNIRILIHDFWDRPRYQILLKYLIPLKKADTMGLFSIDEKSDLKTVEKDYETYKFIPE